MSQCMHDFLQLHKHWIRQWASSCSPEHSWPLVATTNSTTESNTAASAENVKSEVHFRSLVWKVWKCSVACLLQTGLTGQTGPTGEGGTCCQLLGNWKWTVCCFSGNVFDICLKFIIQQHEHKQSSCIRDSFQTACIIEKEKYQTVSRHCSGCSYAPFKHLSKNITQHLSVCDDSAAKFSYGQKWPKLRG